LQKYFKMNVLLLGSGGREHALAWKIRQSEKCSNLWVAPGNTGTATFATNLDCQVVDFEKIKEIVLENKIEMLVVGPEDPLVAGIYDFFKDDSTFENLHIIGPSKKGAELEGSKDFAKIFMEKNQIPTARYQTFTPETLAEGFLFLETLNPPFVLKADGLAAGKGVLIIQDLQEAKKELENMLAHQKFGKASAKVVIEEFLDGIELSCFVLTNGKEYKILPFAKDYKRIGDNDTGLNTGGMGAVSPVPFVDEVFLIKIEEKIVKPTILGLEKDQIIYNGFVFIGLIKVNDEPFVIEYNVRIGDPETEVVIPRIKSDILEMFLAVGNHTLNEYKLEIEEKFASTIVLVSGGYPEGFEKGFEITGLKNTIDSLVFHAGTKMVNDKIVTNGGRVLAVTSFGNTIEESTNTSYQNIEKLNFDKMYCRKDIGKDLL
jgi:phosphoribosylamine---glycine ligase